MASSDTRDDIYGDYHISCEPHPASGIFASLQTKHSVCSLLFFFLFSYWAWGVTGARSLGTSFLRLMFFFFLFSFFQTAWAGRPNRAQPLLRQVASFSRVCSQHGRPVAGSVWLHI